MNRANCTFAESIITKASSRKLVVFVVGSIFFIAGTGLTPTDWMTLATMYIGTQGAVDAFTAVASSISERKKE